MPICSFVSYVDRAPATFVILSTEIKDSSYLQGTYILVGENEIVGVLVTFTFGSLKQNICVCVCVYYEFY